ncbi:MAG: adenine deaminase [Acidobacteriota bacterium]
MKRAQLERYLAQYLRADDFDDVSLNGLQVEGVSEVDKVAFAVSACSESFQKASEGDAQALVVHHGLFWKGQGPERVVGPLRERLKILLEDDLNLFAYHLPLDAHDEVGNNSAAMRALGFSNLAPFGSYHGMTIGWMGELSEPMPRDAFVQQLEAYFGHDALLVPAGSDTVRTAGFISGGAAKEALQAAELDLDIYVTGESSEPVTYLCRESNLNFAALLRRRIRVARGEEPADILFVNGKVVSTFTTEILEIPVAVAEGRVASLGGSPKEATEIVDLAGGYLAPALTDPHIHVESSMLTPEGFAEAVVPHGTGMTVSDPHEIVNVLGLAGLAYMQEASRDLPMDIFYTIPSCVPATHMETAGAELPPEQIEAAFQTSPDAPALSEMMNYPGVLSGDRGVLEKLLSARDRGLPVDGHSPALSGPDLDAYLGAGVTTDHECLTPEEALEKLRRGMWVFMREGSAARNLADLLPVLTPGNLHRLCIASDDRHPEDLVGAGHMDDALRKALAGGVDPLDALRMVTLNPALCYGFRDRGGVAPGYRADLVVFKDLQSFTVKKVYHSGQLVASEGRMLRTLPRKKAEKTLATVTLPGSLQEKLEQFPRSGRVRVIGVDPAQIMTRAEEADAASAGSGEVQYAAVIERHRNTGNVGLGFVRGFQLRSGALASTVSHDSHNLVVVGASLPDMALAAHTLAKMGGGLCCVSDGNVRASLQLEVAGLMSRRTAADVARDMQNLHEAARECGCPLPSPFMTLAFIALPVIPALKLTDRGLVDVNRFDFVPLRL